MPINVTIIEGEHKYLEYLKILLSYSRDIRILGTFQSGEHALVPIANNPPDVVTVELKLLGMSGVEVIKRIKNYSPEVNILVLTKFNDDAHLFPAIKAGAAGYILKDASPAEIINAVGNVYRGHSPLAGRIARRILETFYDFPIKDELTPREKDVLVILDKGYSIKQAARELSISYEGVRSHLKHIYRKLHVDTLIGAINAAKAKGLIENKNE